MHAAMKNVLATLRITAFFASGSPEGGTVYITLYENPYPQLQRISARLRSQSNLTDKNMQVFNPKRQPERHYRSGL